jgi:hypothetical protein
MMKPRLIGDLPEENDVWLPSAKVRALFGGVGAMSFHRWMRGTEFPRPMKFSGRNYWSRRSARAFRARMQGGANNPEANPAPACRPN